MAVASMLNPATVAVLSTLRIEALRRDGSSAIGSGFIYSFKKSIDDTKSVTTLITNKHVVDQSVEIRLMLSTIPIGQDYADIMPDKHVVHYPISLKNPNLPIVWHPDPEIDLCALSLGDPINTLHSQGLTLRHVSLSETWLPDEQTRQILRPIEPILMVGYPNGLWDKVNNLPITRRGLTASHPIKRWNGKRYFVIDVACFGGSSGSPVFLFEDGLFRVVGGGYTPGINMKLLGILFAGPIYTVEGKVIERAIPTNTEFCICS